MNCFSVCHANVEAVCVCVGGGGGTKRKSAERPLVL